MYDVWQRDEWERIAGTKFDSSGLCRMGKTVAVIPKERAASETAILKALTGNPGASPAAIALRLRVSVVDVRRVATKYRGQLSRR